MTDNIQETVERVCADLSNFCGMNYDEAITLIEQLSGDREMLREAVERIARYDVGHQALEEEGKATPTNLRKYYAMQVERRRKIAREALSSLNMRRD